MTTMQDMHASDSVKSQESIFSPVEPLNGEVKKKKKSSKELTEGEEKRHHHHRSKSRVGDESNSSSKEKSSSKDKEKEKEKRTQIGIYSIGDILGKGGFGTVYKGLNTETGSFVAIKQVSLRNCTKDQIENIKSEINLLKKLDHKNIVKYIDHKETKSKLYIIIEFVENGSLQDIVKKFGKMKESLVSMYVGQVLEGLNYLHSEGVIHRDIKGANILTTKDSIVKLADFGVAASLGDAEVDNPVGTPYWMAPEIIEMNPATPASDIWSVGCTVIELLTGSPPYFHLSPMPALYRIVQDDNPPIPPDLSQACKDFLMSCFRKNPQFRPSAKALLNDAWIKSAHRTEELKKQNSSTAATAVKSAASTTVAPTTTKPKLSKTESITKWAEEDSDDDWGEVEAKQDDKATSKEKKDKEKFDTGKNLLVKNMKFDNIIHKKKMSIADDDEDDWGNLGDKPVNLASKLKSKMSQSNNKEEEDPFNDSVETAFNDIKYEFKVTKRDEEMKIENDIVSLFSTLSPSKEPTIICESCTKLLELLAQYPLKKSTIQYAVMPILDVINVENASVIALVMKVANQIGKDTPSFLESLCLVGVLPSVMRFSKNTYSTDIRLQAITFFYRVLHHEDRRAFQMFVACRGLSVFTDFLDHGDENYNERKEIIYMAIENILEIFNIPSSATVRTSKNDFCRLFVSYKIMYNLSKTLMSLLDDKSNKAPEVLNKVITVLLLFSQADTAAKQHMAERIVLQRLFTSVAKLNQDHRLSIAKIIKNLSLDPPTFEAFERADVIPQLVSFLGDKDTRFVNQIINAVFSLLKLNQSRREKAALAGIVPYLKQLIDTNNPLKDFAFDIFCDFSHTSDVTRQELWKNQGVDYYVKLTKVDCWQDKALDSLAKWLKQDTKRVQDELVKKDNIAQIVNLFKSVPNRVYVKLLPPLQKILSLAPKVNKVLGESSDFMMVLKYGLQQSYADAHILLIQLRIVELIYRTSENPKRIMTDIYPVLKDMVNNKNVPSLAKNLAKELMKSLEKNLQL